MLSRVSSALAQISCTYYTCVCAYVHILARDGSFAPREKYGPKVDEILDNS